MGELPINLLDKIDQKKLIPTFDRVLVRVLQIQKSEVIYVPTKERSFFGEVVAVSDKLKDDKQIKVGKKIIFKRWEGTELKFGDEIYVVLNLEDILATV